MGALWLDNMANIMWLPNEQEVMVRLSGLARRSWYRCLVAVAQGGTIVVVVPGDVEGRTVWSRMVDAAPSHGEQLRVMEAGSGHIHDGQHGPCVA